MSDAKRKVLEMVEQKKITAEEGDALLAAMRKEARFALRTLFDPFGRLSNGAMLALGAATAVLSGVAAAALGIRFDGFLDIHAPSDSVGAVLAAADQIAAWPLSALVLWLVAFAFERKSRYVDFLAILGVARVVQLAGGALIALLSPPKQEMAALAQNAVASPSAAIDGVVGMIPMIVVALVCIGWFVTMLVYGFRHASGLRRGRFAAAFVTAFFAAEIVTKIALWGVSTTVGL